MRKKIKYMLESIHMLLLLAMILPVVHMLGMEREENWLYRLYFASYLLVFSIVGIKKAARSCKTLLQYLLCWFGSMLAMGAISWGVGQFILEEQVIAGYVLYTVVGTFAVGLEAYCARMNEIRQKRAKEEMDISFKQREEVLEKPKLPFCFWFVGIYVIALNFACPQVCNISLISTMAYLLVAISYVYITRMETYLSNNDNMCNVRNIPYRRIFGIGKYFLLSYLLVILLAIIPAWLTMDGREYKDIRSWILEREVDYEELLQEKEEESYTGDPMDDVVASYGETKEMPIWLKIVFQSGITLIFVTLLVVLIRWIKEEQATFAQGIDESGDFVESLVLTEEESRIIHRKSVLVTTDEERIRREYRRFIKKHRKELPAAYETPTEMEILAGVTETVKGQELHGKYEHARYGRNEIR